MAPGLRAATAGVAVLGLSSLLLACAPPSDGRQLNAGVAPAALAQPAPPDPDVEEVAATEGEEMQRSAAAAEAAVQQVGIASYYGPQFAGRRMANGQRFDPRSATVAHRTLPFGTTVRVTNLENGRSITAVVLDRGPYVPGRIVDLSPRLAEHLGMVRQGVVPVEVIPLVEVAEAPE
jgi:rare lipoprotein A